MTSDDWINHDIILYDGVCGLCNQLIQFVLKKDRKKKFYFASIQSIFGSSFLRQHGKNPNDLEALFLITNFRGPTEKILSKADALFYILSKIGGVWKISGILKMIPRPLLNKAYDVLARSRYRLFGRIKPCEIPLPRHLMSL